MKKLILLLLFIPLVSYSQETRPSFAIKTSTGDYLNDYKIQYPNGFVVRENLGANTYMRFLENPTRKQMIKVYGSNIINEEINIKKIIAKEIDILRGFGEMVSIKKVNNKGVEFINQKYLNEKNEAFSVSIFSINNYLFTIIVASSLHPSELFNEEILEKMFKECTELLDEMINNFV
tara:strand:- start:3579 stop:4109 length:531 start_codon:yes stop_codon:yes gene_type:complete